MLRGLAVVFSLSLAHLNSASAESAGDAIGKFGLVGSWSADCSRPIAAQKGLRWIWEVPVLKAPTLTVVAKITDDSVLTQVRRIENASEVTSERINYDWTLLSSTFKRPDGTERAETIQQPNKNETVIEKVGAKFRLFYNRRLVGGKETVSVENGEQVVGSVHIPSALFEKCSN